MSDEPLAGINVLDLTIAWAGPMATRILASLGATVVKLENPLKLDSWRGYDGSPRERFPDQEPGAAWWNRNAWFNTQNHDKLSLCINLKAPAAQPVKARALAWADVVIANFAPGALDRLGLGFDAAVAVNPDIVVVEMPAFGNDGPLSHHVGMGQTMEAASGMASLMGYDGDHPALTGTAFLDPAGGLHGAAAVLTALYLRELTGEAQYVEVPQVEAALHWIGPQILAAEAGAEPAPAAGNAVESAAPHDAYRCAGDDEWVAIEVRSELDWSALCAVIGRPDLERDASLGGVTGRRGQAGAIRAAIEAWSTQFTKEGAARQLQRGGVIAAPVATGADIASDPHLWARGFFTALDHPDCGRHAYPGVAVRAGVTPRPLGRAAPRLGADNAAALELFGLSAAEAAELERQGVTATRPGGPVSAAGPFGGLRVVEHTRHLAGAVAGRMFAALGAEVVSVGPGAAADAEDAVFWHLSAGKRLARADESTPAGRAVVADLLASGPDVWICDTLGEAGLVAGRAGGTIAAAVSDFGESGPRRDWRGSEMIHQALSGVMGQTGEAGREPLFGLSSRAYSAAGVALFGSVVARLFARERQRGGRAGAPSAPEPRPEPPLEVTVTETAASMGQNEVTTYGYSGTWPRRGRYPGLVGKVPCADGWVVVFGLGRWDVICRAFRCPELAVDGRFALVPDRIAHWQEALGLLAEAARGLTRDEVVTAAQGEHATVEHINTLADLRRSEHLAQRGFWRDGAPDAGGPGVGLGPVFRVRSRPEWVTAPARPAETGEPGLPASWP